MLQNLDKEYLSYIYQFIWVAEFKNFSKAANYLNLEQSSISRAIKKLETHLGIKLLVRTTRKLSLTQAGEQLYNNAKSGFLVLSEGIANLNNLRNKPSGKVRISANRHVINQILIPKLASIAQEYPEVQLEFIENSSFIDIIAEGYTAGIRLGADVQDGMVAQRITQPLEMVVVGSPTFLAKHGTPKTLEDLNSLPCLALQFNSGRIYNWQFKDPATKETIYHKPKGSWIVNDSESLILAAKHGIGLAYETRDYAEQEIADGSLVCVLDKYSINLDSLYIYYPSRNISAALNLIVAKLKV